MNLLHYLARINYPGGLEPNAENLRLLQRSHMLSVPFENLDIHLNRPIQMDIDHLYDKIVTRCRGGFCYEQNGLFASILRLMGYTVNIVEARVADKEGNYRTPFDHMALIVTLEDRWLVDVGFGDAFLEPLLLDDPNPQERNSKHYRLHHNDAIGYYETLDANGWQPGYRFDLTPRQISDFSGGCHYHQTSPDSHFTQKRVCSLATETGRITLSELTFIETENGVRQERSLENESAFTTVLEERFGVVL